MTSIRPSDDNIRKINVNESHLIADGFILTKLPNGKYGYFLPFQPENTNKTKKQQNNSSSLCVLY